MNAIVKKFEDDLREYADLRNAIVHHRTGAEYAIAEPHDDIVELIEYIDRELSKPVTVSDLFLRKVHTLQSTDTLGVGLKLIREKKFNQIPIYQNKMFIGLVTSVGITQWLADNVTSNFISREMPMLIDIYSHEKKRNTSRFIKIFRFMKRKKFSKRLSLKGNVLKPFLLQRMVSLRKSYLGLLHRST